MCEQDTHACARTHTHTHTHTQTLERKNLNPKKPEDKNEITPKKGAGVGGGADTNNISPLKKDVRKEAPKEAPGKAGGGGGSGGGGGGKGAGGAETGSRPSSVNLNEMLAGVQNMFSAQDAKLSPRTRL